MRSLFIDTGIWWNTNLQVIEKKIVIDGTWFSAEREVARSKGLHLSAVLDFIEGKERGIMTPEERARMSNYTCAGFLWERVLDKLINLPKEEMFEWLFTRAMVDVNNPDVFRPGEQCADLGECHICNGTGRRGIRACPACKGKGRLDLFATPDGICVSSGFLEEWKYTSKSFKGGITQRKFERWTAYQIPFYLKVLNLTTCTLRALFSRGDYTTGEPVWGEYTLIYSQPELDDIFEMICNNARALISKMYE